MVATRSRNPKPNPDVLKAVGQRLLADWTDLKNRRVTLDNQMLENHYQYRGRFSPADLAAIKQTREEGCTLYIGLTRTKVRTLDARINEMAFGSAKKNWSIEPTPEPEMTEEALAEAAELAVSDPDSEGKSDLELVRMVARRRAEAMDRQMEDDLVEADYDRLFRRVTHHGHKHAVGILKGPLVNRQMRRSWGYVVEEGPDGGQVSRWAMKREEVVKPYFEVCSPWDMYLEWTEDRPEDSDWYFQRHLFRREAIARMAGNRSFFRTALLDWIRLNPEGDAQWEDWENQLYQYAKEASTLPSQRRKWELIEGWGPLQAEELGQLGMEPQLKAMGIKLDELSAALVESHVWLDRQGRVFGMALNMNEDASKPYSFYCPTPDDDSVYGTSFPQTVRPVEKAFTGAWRMTMDNAATAVGPQIEVRTGRLWSQTDLNRMTPYRMWPVKEAPWNSANPAIQFTDFPIHTAVFLGLINSLQVIYDEVGGVPRYQHGANAAGGVGRTASGLAMLMGAAGQLVKDQLRAWDDFQGDVLRKLFNYEMQFSPRNDIKGDHRVHVRTTSSLLQKAERAQEIRQFRLTTANPMDGPLTKRPEMLRIEAEAMDMNPDEVVKTKEDMEAEMEMMADAQAQQAQAEAEGIPGGEPGGQGQPPSPSAPGPTGVPMAAEGGYVNESLGDVLSRLPAGPLHSAGGGRVTRHPQSRPPLQNPNVSPEIAGSVVEDIAGVERDYLGGA